MGGIVGFDIQIDRLEGKWKLSQNHPAERREKVISGLLATGDYESSQVASLMIEIKDV
jgi:transcriptional regulator